MTTHIRKYLNDIRTLKDLEDFVNQLDVGFSWLHGRVFSYRQASRTIDPDSTTTLKEITLRFRELFCQLDPKDKDYKAKLNVARRITLLIDNTNRRGEGPALTLALRNSYRITRLLFRVLYFVRRRCSRLIFDYTQCTATIRKVAHAQLLPGVTGLRYKLGVLHRFVPQSTYVSRTLSASALSKYATFRDLGAPESEESYEEFTPTQLPGSYFVGQRVHVASYQITAPQTSSKAKSEAEVRAMQKALVERLRNVRDHFLRTYGNETYLRQQVANGFAGQVLHELGFLSTQIEHLSRADVRLSEAALNSFDHLYSCVEIYIKAMHAGKHVNDPLLRIREVRDKFRMLLENDRITMPQLERLCLLEKCYAVHMVQNNYTDYLTKYASEINERFKSSSETDTAPEVPLFIKLRNFEHAFEQFFHESSHPAFLQLFIHWLNQISPVVSGHAHAHSSSLYHTRVAYHDTFTKHASRSASSSSSSSASERVVHAEVDMSSLIDSLRRELEEQTRINAQDAELFDNTDIVLGSTNRYTELGRQNGHRYLAGSFDMRRDIQFIVAQPKDFDKIRRVLERIHLDHSISLISFDELPQ